MQSIEKMDPEDQTKKSDKENTQSTSNTEDISPAQTSPGPGQRPHLQPTTQDGKDTKAQDTRRFRDAARRALEGVPILTVVLAVATAVQAVVSIAQWSALRDANAIAQQAGNAAKQSADVARQALVITQKAVIAVNLPPVLNIQQKPFTYQVSYTNVGPTSAKNAASNVKYKIVTADSPVPDYDKDTQDFGPSYFLTPHEEVSITPKYENELSEDQKNLLKNPGSTLVIYGKVNFSDEFNQRFSAHFCQFYQFNEDLSQRLVGLCPGWSETILLANGGS